MKNVIILNQAHTSNIGDIAIGESITEWVNSNGWNPLVLPFWDELKIFKRFSYTKISGLIKSISILSNLFIGKWVRKVVAQTMADKNIDCVIVGGGELFGSHRGFNAVFSCWVREFIKNGIPVCVIGVSGDKKLSKSQIKRNKKALSQCFLVGVRDRNSVNVFEELYDVNAFYAPDSVFMLNVNNSCVRNNNKTNRALCIPIRLNSNNKILDGFKSDVEFYYKKLCETGCHDVIFTATEERDQEYIENLCKSINSEYGSSYEFKSYNDLNAFCNLLSCVDYVVSARMHAMILGLLYGCTPKPVLFKKKLEVFDNEYCCGVNLDIIVSTTKEAYKKYAEIITNKIGK